MSKAVMTDFSFELPDVERSIIEPLGCELIANKEHQSQDALVELVRDADFVMTQFAPVDAEIIGAMQKCKVIVRYGIGVDNVDLTAAAKKGIPVCNVPDYCIDEVADHTLAMILDLCRRTTQNALTVSGGEWQLGVPLSDMRSLKSQTVGIVAYGRIGREVALRLRAFKCRIVATDPIADPEQMRADGVEPVTLEQLYSESDIITLHCPSTDSTRHMINSDSINKMKNRVLLINNSRGTLVKTDDLAVGLEEGKIGGAALDVTDPEPINADSPLVKMENVLVTAHVASASPQAVNELRTQVANTVSTAFKGGQLPNIVNGVLD